MEDRCICCGTVIPEGRMVCINCEIKNLVKRRSNIFGQTFIMRKGKLIPIDNKRGCKK